MTEHTYAIGIVPVCIVIALALIGLWDLVSLVYDRIRGKK